MAAPSGTTFAIVTSELEQVQSGRYMNSMFKAQLPNGADQVWESQRANLAPLIKRSARILLSFTMGTQQLAPGLAVPVYRASSVLLLSEVQDGMRDDGAASAPASPARQAAAPYYPPTYPTGYVTETSRHQEWDISVLPPAPSPVRLAPKPQGRSYADDEDDLPALLKRPAGRPPKAVVLSDDDDDIESAVATDDERVVAPTTKTARAPSASASRASTSPYARAGACRPVPSFAQEWPAQVPSAVSHVAAGVGVGARAAMVPPQE